MKVVFIIPYYGEFPNYFKLFLKTCQNNLDYNWIIFSENNARYVYPDNVCYVEMPWQKLKILVQSKFDFKISLDTPYKLCDFKPAYGYIFEEYIEDYDYWGYCDMDLLWGDLKAFIPYEKIEKFDKIGHLGHMTLFRNSKDINRLFMSKIDNIFRYKEIFMSSQSLIFDEWNWISINHIFIKKNKKVWLFEDFFDIYPYDDNFKKVIRKIPVKNESYGKDVIEMEPSFASIEKGKAYQWKFNNKKWVKSEISYLHFQKRTMQVFVEDSTEKILCVPDQFVPFDGEHISNQYLKKMKLHCFLNKKSFNLKKKKIIYWIIEKSSTIRRIFQHGL